MKKLTLIILPLLLLLLLTGCEKIVLDGADGVQPDAADGQVTISVDGANTSYAGFETRSSLPVEEVCTRLCFAVYQGGTRLKYDNQKLGDADFGTATFTLDAGTYQLLILGHSGQANPATTKPEQVKFTNLTASGGTGYTDTFYYYGQLEVTGSTPQLRYTLERASAMLRLIVRDAVPSQVSQFYFYYTGGSGQLDVTTGYGSANSQQKVTLPVTPGLQSQQFELYTFPHADGQPVKFKIEAQTSTGETLFTRELQATMEPNIITQYSGNFFSSSDPITDPDPDPDQPDTSSSSILVDTEWGGVEEFSY